MNENGFIPQDYKYVASAEGEGLTESYEWFKDPEVIKSFVDSCSELLEDGQIAPETQNNLNVLGIGSGTGNLEQRTVEMLRNKGLSTDLFITDMKKLYEDKTDGNEMPDKVFEFNKSHPIDNPDGDSYMYGHENKEMAVSGDSMDLVLARSVTHYEKTPELERKVLVEILRVLKPGGYFIDQAPTLSTHSEAKLIQAIHNLLPKEMNIQTKEETGAMLSEIFDVHEAKEEHQPKPLPTNKGIFMKRYDITEAVAIEELTRKITEMINSIPDEERPNVWFNREKNDFGWNIPFTIYKCQKPQEESGGDNA